MSFETALKNLTYGLEDYLNIMVTPVSETTVTSETTSENPEYAVFQHEIADIFNEVKKRTAFIGKFMKDPKTGESLMEEYAMTDDEIDIFDTINRSASNKIFSAMTAYTKKILKAFIYDSGPVIEPYVNTTEYEQDNVGNYYSYDGHYYKLLKPTLPGYTPGVTGHDDVWELEPDYIDTLDKVSIMIEFPVTNNTNTLSIIDKLIFDCHVFFDMFEWFEQVGKFDIAANWKSKFEETLSSFQWNLTKTKEPVKIAPVFP